MAAWSLHSSDYKVGVLMLFLGAGLYLLGFVSPFWIHHGAGVYGLWLNCWFYSGDLECRPHTPSPRTANALFHVILAMQCLGLLSMTLSCVYAVIINCCHNTVSLNHYLEMMTLSSSVLGVIGCIGFVVLSTGHLHYLSWSFGVNVTGCVLLGIATYIIFGSNRLDMSNPRPGMTRDEGEDLWGCRGCMGLPSMREDSMEMVPLSQTHPGSTYPPQAGTGYDPAQGNTQAVTHAGFAPPLQAVGASGVTPPQAASTTCGVTSRQAASTTIGATPPQATSTTCGVTPPQGTSTPGVTPFQAASTTCGVTPPQAASTPGVTPPQATSTTSGVTPPQAASTHALQAGDTPQTAVESDYVQNVSLEQMYKVWGKGCPQ